MKLRSKEILDQFLGRFLMALLKPPTYCLGLLMKRDHTLDLRGDVAFVKLAGGGSLVIAYPSLLGLKRAHPNSRFVLVTTPSVAPFPQMLNIFSQVLIIDDRSLFSLVISTLKALRAIFRIDTVIDLEAYGRLTTVFSLLTAARNRVSFFLVSAFWRRRIATHLIFFNRFSPTYQFYDQICTVYGTSPASLDECRAELVKQTGSSSLGARGDAEGSRPTLRIGIGHACSELGKERMLSPAQWLYVLEHRFPLDTALEVHFLGAPADGDAAEEIARLLLTRYSAMKIINHCGKVLRDSIATLRDLDEFWGIDSALIHFSRLLKVPTTSFWGPTDPTTRLRPMEGLREEVHYDKLPCSPCVHVAAQPPCRGDNACIKNLTEDDLSAKRMNPPWIIS